MNKKTIKNILIIFAGVVVLFIAYSYFLKGEDKELLTSALVSSTDGSPVVGELFVILNELSSLKIDLSLFEDPTYHSLQDYTVILTPEAFGRVNPFDPIE